MVFGKPSGFAADINLKKLNGRNGFKLSGATAYGSSGWSVATAGDVNGDGFDDVIIGAGAWRAGASYVVFGKASGFAANIDLSSLDGRNGFKLSGVAEGGWSGRSVASAGDVNSDGFADLIVGAPGFEASYVIFGRAPDSAVKRIGTDASQTLAGGAFNDNLSGRGGNDTLFGHGGDDTLEGGAGNDTLLGGAGNDTARYASAAAGVTVDVAIIDAQDTGGAGIDTLDSIENVVGSAFADRLSGNGAANVLTGREGDDTLIGGTGNDTLEGGNGADRLEGGSGHDLLIGGGGADLLIGGAGQDTFAYSAVSKSTSRAFDTIADFNATADFFDLPVTVSGIDQTISSGRLDDAHFNGDLAAAANAATLLAHHAVVFKPGSGSHAGETFLLVDANGVAGYQRSQDFVFRLDSPGHMSSLSTERFV